MLPSIGKRFSYINTNEIMTMNLRYNLVCSYVVYRVGFGFWFLMCVLLFQGVPGLVMVGELDSDDAK